LTDPLTPRPVPLLTPDLPGTSGVLRVSEEDFSVEELPLYEPSGAGEHLYLTVEKRGRTTPDVAEEIARRLGARERDVGTAGLKDRRALTVQRISVRSRRHRRSKARAFASWPPPGTATSSAPAICAETGSGS